jgi:hypothetical protein
MNTFFIGGEFSEKDLGLLKNFFMEKYNKVISQKAFENFLMLSASQHVLFEKGENPFVPKTARYFNGPFLDIEVDIQPKFSIRGNIYPQQIINYPSPLIYTCVRNDYINDKYFPQERFKGANLTARLWIVSLKEVLNLESIIDLANKEMKGFKNLSKFAIRVLHNIALNNKELLSLFKKGPIIIPYKSKKEAINIGCPIPIFSTREHDGKFIWDFGWENIRYLEGHFVALLFQK